MLKKFSLFASLIFLVASCSSDEESGPTRNIEDYVSAVMKDNHKVIFFGSAGLKGIIDKTNYKNQPMIAGPVSSEIKKLNSVIDIDSPIHFLAEGEISKDGMPDRILLFMHIKDADKLESELKSGYSYLVEKVGDVRYAEDSEFIIAFRNDLAIAIIQQGEYDTKSVVKKLFKKSEGKVSGGEIDKMLQVKGDFVMNVMLENLYTTSNTELAKLDESKKTSIESMVKDSYIQSTLNFEKGGLTIESKNYFSKELQEMMFFKSGGSSEISQTIARGNGNIVGGFSMNVDVKKLEAYYSTYVPDLFDEMDSKLSEMGGLMKYVSTGNILSSLITGQLGAVAIAESKNGELEMGVRSFVGANEAGQKVLMMARGEMNLSDDFEFNYSKGGIETLFPISESSMEMMKGDRKLKMPAGSENFGKKGVYGFINFNEIPGGLGSMEQDVVDMLDYATLEGDNDGMKIHIRTKNQDDNILNQAVSFAISMFTF